MKKILALTICLLNTVSAGVIKPGGTLETEDFKISDDRYTAIAREASTMLNPIRAQAKEVSNAVETPFNEQIAQIKQQCEPIDAQISEISGKVNELRNEWSVFQKRLKVELEETLKHALTPMCTALEVLRAPIQDQVAQLRERRSEIEKKYDADFLKLGWQKDAFDEMDISFRTGSINTQIKELYASVDGVLPDVIKQTDQSIRDLYAARLDAERKRMWDMIDAAVSERDQLSLVIDGFLKQSLELERQKNMAVNEAMPNYGRLLAGLQEQLVGEIISAASEEK